MNTLRILLLTALLVPAAHAQVRGTPVETVPVMPVAPTVTVPTTASELATGYAAAIPQMSLKSLVIYLRSEGKIVPIKGIRLARAMGAVLLIEFSAGDRMAVNAEHIVMITDGTRTP
ncbi:MAG: hypothetical protein HYV75_10285 [Opitutae bacterium]|nr:hypothetical protein [Opitutae bacterium]